MASIVGHLLLDQVLTIRKRTLTNNQGVTIST